MKKQHKIIKIAVAKDAHTKPYDFKFVDVRAIVYDGVLAIHPKVNETDRFNIAITHISTGYLLYGAKYKTVAEKMVKIALECGIDWNFSDIAVAMSNEYQEKAAAMGQMWKDAGLIPS